MTTTEPNPIPTPTFPYRATMIPLYRAIALRLVAVRNCEESGNAEWLPRHKESINQLVREHMPSGTGYDNGTSFDFDDSRPNKLVFDTSFHHMDENGFYDGWTLHAVIVEPDLAFGIRVRVTGRDRRDVKDYIAEDFQNVLTDTMVPQYA